MSKLASLVKRKIEREIGYDIWYGRHLNLGAVSAANEIRFACIAHDDSSPSASLNLDTGLWKCFAGSCEAKGDVIEFYRLLKGLGSITEAIHRLAMDVGIIVEITTEMIDTMHEALLQHEEALSLCKKHLGVSVETLKRFKIGMHRKSDTRWTLPIQGASGMWEDIRRYNPLSETKLLHWASGHGAARIFPIEELQKNSHLYLFEGEKDCLRALDMGVKGAVTVTSGAGALPEDHELLFRDKSVIILYDIDPAGVKGAATIARRLSPLCSAVGVCRLPPEGLPENGDFSDWANLGNGYDDFLELIQEHTERVERPRVKVDRPATFRADTSHSPLPLLAEGELLSEEVAFVEMRHDTLYNVPIKFVAHCVGQSAGMMEFGVATSVETTCGRNAGKLCDDCIVKAKDPDQKTLSFDIDLADEHTLDLIHCNRGQYQSSLKRVIGIPPNCYKVKLNEKSRRPIQTLLLTPPVEPNRMREEVDFRGHRLAYYHGDAVPDNRDYWFYGFLHCDPKNRESVLNVSRAEPARNLLEHFQLTDEVKAAIQYFTPSQGQSLDMHLDTLHRQIENDIGIYGRHELQMAVLETIYSVRAFSLGEKRIANGWNEIVIIGDTRTGKSEVAQRMIRMINVGEYISCENTSAAGLIGGITYVDKVGIPRWGAWPRNNDGFLVLDEVDALVRHRENIIEQLSAIRSNGQAEITKIVSARTAARVRAVWITNPVDGQRIKQYNGGVRALPGIFRSRQDIARFVKAYAVSSDDVDVETITDIRPRLQDDQVREHFNNLAMLVWSLEKDQVVFSEQAITVLKHATHRLVEKYSDAIPLVEKGSCLDKLAKLSIPIAALSGSFDLSGDQLILHVSMDHVTHTVQHLERTYDQPIMGYDEFSRLEFDRERIVSVAEVQKSFVELEERKPHCDFETMARFFLTATSVTRHQFTELVGDSMLSQDCWAQLIRNNCLRVDHRDTYVKTGAFVDLLTTMMQDFKRCQLKDIVGVQG